MSWITSLLGSIFAGLGWLVLGVAVVVAVALNIFKALIPSWVAPLIIVALGAAFVGSNSIKSAEIAALQQQHADTLAHIAQQTAAAHQAALAAEQAVAAREQSLQATIDQYAQEARNAQAEIHAARAAADTAAERLRIALNTIRAGARHAPDPAASPARQREGQPGPDPLDLLSDVLDRHSGELVRVSEYADRLRAAGIACERSYDAARGELGE